MQTLTLKVQDHAIQQVMELLKQLPKNTVEVLPENIEVAQQQTNFSNAPKLNGMFAHLVSDTLTDDEIEQAITDGAYARAMQSKNEHV